MDIIEKSKEYAKGKAFETMTAAIEQAYADGYNDGMKHIENEKLEAMKDGVEFIDLNLPSGTKWSSTCLYNHIEQPDLMTYMEASKLNIPTKEQFEELCSNCAIDIILETKKNRIQFTGINGEKLDIPYVNINEITKDLGIPRYIAFWLKDDGEKKEKFYARVNEHKKL